MLTALLLLAATERGWRWLMHAITGALGREIPGERRRSDAARARADAAYGCVDWYCYDAPQPPANSQQLGAAGPGTLREPSLEAKTALGA